MQGPNTNKDVVEILLIEDNKGDIRFTKEALKETGLNTNVSEIYDGEEAINYLKDVSRNAKLPVPDMILLDLELPKKTGHEVLQFIKSEQKLKGITVAILTSSTIEEDVFKAYRFSPSGYITKKDNYKDLAKAIEGLWCFSSLQRKPLKPANKLNKKNGTV